MILGDLPQVMDRPAAKLAKLEAVWPLARPMLPSGPSRGSSREHEDLRRTWAALLSGLPPVNGWTVTEQLADIDEAGQSFIDSFEIGEPAFEFMNQLEEPGNQLGDDRLRLPQSRRRAIHERPDDLTSIIGDILPRVVESILRNSTDRLDDATTPRHSRQRSARSSSLSEVRQYA